MKLSSRNKLVLPGDAIGVEEEFIPVSGAYVDTGGFIRSMIIGLTSIDVFKKTLVIKKIIDKPIVPKQGDIVEGVISSLSDDIAFIDIYAVNNRYDKSIDFTGVIHVSQASQEFVKSLFDIFRLGDVVRAKVLNNNNPFQLTTKDPVLGVIVAYCSLCGNVLYRRDDRLVCSVCGNIENRKISIKYYMYV